MGCSDPCASGDLPPFRLVPATRYPSLDQSVVRSVCEILARTHGGLTNKQIDDVLTSVGISDPTPPAPSGMYVAINKRDRLYRAVISRQQTDECSNAVLLFIARALAPVRFHQSPAGVRDDAQRGERAAGVCRVHSQ
jgi:hypothetical protein